MRVKAIHVLEAAKPDDILREIKEATKTWEDLEKLFTDDISESRLNLLLATDERSLDDLLKDIRDLSTYLKKSLDGTRTWAEVLKVTERSFTTEM